MTRLRDYDWATSYSTSNLAEDGAPVDILRDFYLPALERSTRYDRVAGYFSSSSLAVASRGFSRFLASDGRARFIVGAELGRDDVQAILDGDAARLEAGLEEGFGQERSWPSDVRRRVELLAWLVAQGRLEIRVAVRVDAGTGRAEPLDYRGDGYVHEKWAIFEDEEDALAVAGSLNESRTALELNAENLEIFPNWEGKRDAARVREKRRAFDAMWEGRHPSIRVYRLPDALERRIVKIGERVRTPREIADDFIADDDRLPSHEERLKFAIIRLAPLLPGGQYVGMETAPISPWPHQRFTARRIIDSYPDNLLLCDEVGLGKTIEAGLAFRSLWLSGRARSIRVFAPASLTSQWLHEMSEKFLLPFRRRLNRDGHCEIVDPHTGNKLQDFSTPFEDPLQIYSTGLVNNDRKSQFFARMPATDIVLLDEAHKARRAQPDRIERTPDFNRLYRMLEERLAPKARALLMATATPMQLNPVEAYDLLRFMPAAGAVRCVPDLSRLLYTIRDALVNGQGLDEFRSDFLRRYLSDVRRTAPLQWTFVYEYVLTPIDRSDLELFIDDGIKPFDWRPLQPALSMS